MMLMAKATATRALMVSHCGCSHCDACTNNTMRPNSNGRPVGERPLIPVTAKTHYSLGVALFFVSAPSPPDARCSARTARRS